MIRQGVRICRYAVRIIPKRCPDVTGNSVRMLPKYALNKIEKEIINNKQFMSDTLDFFKKECLNVDYLLKKNITPL